MELLTEKQVSEMIVDYENRVKALIEKIKGELQNRKELKKKLEETKQREALQLQILERLEESEKMVRKQLDLVAKMEDNESQKQIQLINKYKQMLNSQIEKWEKYKEQYESLPSVQKVREAEREYLCATIKYGLNVQKMKDTQRMIQLRDMVRKKLEQKQIIRFAELYVVYKKKEKRCLELWDQNRRLTMQKQQLQSQLQEKERLKQQKLDNDLQKTSTLMKPQQLPQVDLSRFIIQRNKGNDKLDTMSINSYILEEEYMKNNGESSQKLNSSQNKAMDVDTQDSMQMDVDSQEVASQEREVVQSNEPPKQFDYTGPSDNEGKAQCTPPVGECEQNKTFDQTMDSQERNQESHFNSSGNKNSPSKRMNHKQQRNKENTPKNESSASNGIMQTECATPYDSPIPTPAKPKSSFQVKHPRKQTSKQEMSQYQQNTQSVKRSLQEIQQQQNQFQQIQKQEIQQQQNQFQQIQKQEKIQQQQQQTPRHTSQEMYQQQQHSSRRSSQEMYQQQQQQQQQQQISRDAYQQKVQQQTPQYSPQESYQQNQHQQEMYMRTEQRQAFIQQSQSAQVSPQNSEQMDFSKLPSAKPRVISNEYVNFDLQALQPIQRKSVNKGQPEVQPTARSLTQTPASKNSPVIQKNESTPFAQQGPFALGLQSSVNVTPISAEIHPSSMMSTSMYSMDNYLPDNMSAILGSEITEPGGSFELARRLYESDLNSENGDFDIDTMMSACSPLNKISPKIQHPQVPERNNSTQPPANSSSNQNNQESNERVFTFGGFAKKPTNTQRFF